MSNFVTPEANGVDIVSPAVFKSDANGPFTDEIRDAFRVYVPERYLSVTTEAIRKVDPNHMILGSRFYWNDRIYYNDNQSGMLTNPLLFHTAGKYMDIVSCL